MDRFTTRQNLQVTLFTITKALGLLLEVGLDVVCLKLSEKSMRAAEAIAVGLKKKLKDVLKMTPVC